MGVRAIETTILLSLDDEEFGPNMRLYSIAQDVALFAPFEKHLLLSERPTSSKPWYQYFPGEHYHLLSCVAKYLRPKVIWELGTGDGMSAVAIREGAPEARIYTVDNSPHTGELIRKTDNIVQIFEDFANLIPQYQHILCEAELIFIDGPKDGHTEAKLLNALDTIQFLNDPLFIFDDIRVMNMVHVWRGIKRPKMDLTSFGHFTGTGLVDWNGGVN